MIRIFLRMAYAFGIVFFIVGLLESQGTAIFVIAGALIGVGANGWSDR